MCALFKLYFLCTTHDIEKLRKASLLKIINIAAYVVSDLSSVWRCLEKT